MNFSHMSAMVEVKLRGYVCKCVYRSEKCTIFFFCPVKEGAYGQCEIPKDPRYPDCSSKMDVSVHISLKSQQFRTHIKTNPCVLSLVPHKCSIG